MSWMTAVKTDVKKFCYIAYFTMDSKGVMQMFFKRGTQYKSLIDKTVTYIFKIYNNVIFHNS